MILLCAFCRAGTAENKKTAVAQDVDGIGRDYMDNQVAIEQKKQEMLAMDGDVNFWFSGDEEFQSQDPHAYWLMNRMMQMVRLVQTADDDWAWMLAMNESVGEYNSRLGRKIGSVGAAANAMGKLIDIYNAGNQPELNTASYVESIIEHYNAVYAYYRLMGFIKDYDDESDWDVRMQALYYREFKEWFDLNNAASYMMSFYTYAAADYSALPMDMNGTFEGWSKARLAELEIERNIFRSYFWQPFESDVKAVSAKEFGELLAYFKTMTQNDVIEEVASDWMDRDYARKRFDGRYDFDKIAETARDYETALVNWRKVRERIARMLPKEKRKSYREITKRVHARLYDDLLDLKEIRY